MSSFLSAEPKGRTVENIRIGTLSWYDYFDFILGVYLHTRTYIVVM